MASWPEVVATVGKWYEKNIHTYQFALGYSRGPGRIKGSNKEYAYPGGYGARDDCSGFVSCCLQVYGVIPKHSYVSNDAATGKAKSTILNSFNKAGFQRIPYSKDILQPYDIVYVCKRPTHSHTEIIHSINGGSIKVWSWGNVHDGLTYGNRPRNAGMPCGFSNKPYEYIYRLTGLTGVNIDLSAISVESANFDGLIGGNIDYSQFSGELMDALQSGINAAGPKKYYQNENYLTFANQYPDLFSESNPNLNSLIQSAYSNLSNIGRYVEQKKDDNIQGRVYSTNDAEIVLDELSLPTDYKSDEFVSSNIKDSERKSKQSNYDNISDAKYLPGKQQPKETTNNNNNNNNSSTN